MKQSSFDRDQLARALEESVRPSDKEPTRLEKIEMIKERFYRSRNLIANKKAWLLDQTDDDLALQQLKDMAALLREGAQDATMQDLLVKFLDSVKDPVIVRLVLGLPKANHRPSKEHLIQRAAAAYELAISENMEDEMAMRKAYNAYRPALREQSEDRYTVDSCRPTTVDGMSTNEAAKFTRKPLRSVLRKAGVLEKKQPGRPRNTPKN